MSTITYTISQDFGNNPANLQESQLMTQILASNISFPCINVSRYGDNVNISFAGILSNNDSITLNAIVATFVAIPMPVPSVATIDPVTRLITHTVNNVPYKYLGNQTNEVIISKGTQGHYSSIKSAVLANSNINTIYLVYPGNYVENNPITLPAGSVLKGAGTAQNTIIIAANQNQTMVNLGVGAEVQNMTFYGAKATGGKGIYLDCTQSNGTGAISALLQVFIVDCDIGIEADNKNALTPSDVLFLDKCIIKTKTQSCSKGFYAHSGGSILSTSCEILGIPPVPNLIPNGYPFANAIYCTDPLSKISMVTTASWYNTVTIFLDNEAAIETVLIMINNSDTGIRIGSNGTTSSIMGDNIYIKNSTTWDIDILSSDAELVFMAEIMDPNMINNPNNVNLNIRYNTIKFGKLLQGAIGDTQFGTTKIPAKVCIGEGQYVTDNVSVLSNDNYEVGNWIDNSIAANSSNPPPFNPFSGTTQNNCMYIGLTRPILGFKIEVNTPTNNTTNMTDLIWEYWDGQNWVQFNIMQNTADVYRYTYMNSFLSEVGKYQIRFGLKSNTPFALKTLNGISQYWVRIRIINPLPNIPVCMYLKLHVNCKIISSDGVTERFGNSRVIINIPTGLEGHYPSNSSLGNQELFVSKNLSIQRTNNVFLANSLCRIGSRTILPNDIDISFQIKIEIAFIGDNTTAGNVYWSMRSSITKQGSNIYRSSTDAPIDPPNTKLLTKSTTINAKDTCIRDFFLLDINNVNTNPADGETSILWMSLERDSRLGNGNDTYPGNISLILVKCSYVSYIDGSHVLSF